ncbi:MAG TPA: hypothetical protein VG323_18605 [Thermoanaerobaculia bacterium]|nr:hypothetical protein [Thermoanaerobaculia bacterium]
MSAQIVFLTLFLGLASGSQTVVLQVNGPVKIVRLFLDRREVASMTAPPWRASIELGADLTPRELTAIGFDANELEIARATQILNLPRPAAELEIALQRNIASLRWRHLTNAKPAQAKIAVDGKPLALRSEFDARLPPLDPALPHLLEAEMKFEDGLRARCELVIHGDRFSDSTGTELTPVLVRETSAQHRRTWDGCATSNGAPVRIAAVEKPRATVIVVRDPDSHDVQLALDSTGRVWAARSDAMRHLIPLDDDTEERMLWPVTERYEKLNDATAVLFRPSFDVDASDIGMLRFLLMSGPDAAEPLRFADAVAVAGLRAMSGSQRRAVVLVSSGKSDVSVNSPAAVRRYLESIGVPLFVWSVSGSSPELVSPWGQVDDVSSLSKLNRAVARLRRALAEQRVAWVAVDPLNALQLKTRESCGISPVAHR